MKWTLLLGCSLGVVGTLIVAFIAICVFAVVWGNKQEWPVAADSAGGDVVDVADVADDVPKDLIDASHLKAVDLGLSVLWSTANFGAEDDEGYGDFESWPVAMDMQFTDGWRLPTREEWQELADCRFEMVQRPSDVRVFVFYGKNGRSIALTTNGYTDEDGNQDFGFYGYYWSSSRSDDGLYPYAFRTSVPDDNVWTDKADTDMHFGMRLVREKPEHL